MSVYPPLPDPPPSRQTIVPAPPSAEPSRPSRKPLVVALVVLFVLGGTLAAVATWLSTPGRCDSATFTSDRFGYCVAAPPGWSAEPARVGQTPVDSFLQSDGSAAVYVQAVDLQEGQTLDAFAEYVRGLGEQGGFSMGTTSETEVGGVPAVSWDVVVSSATGEVRMREVVFVRSGTAWRVQFADSAGGFEAHSAEFQQMLATWHFA